MTRANAITFAGGTNILELQAGSIITGNVVAFSSADTLRLGGNASASFDVSQIGTQYLGFGIFKKAGSSVWTVTGSNSAAMPWAVNAGTLAVNATMANAIMAVNGGGTLAGTGTVGSVIVAGGGTFAPGNPLGTMTVQGNLAFQSGALYLVQVNPSTSSLANVTGTATLTGGSVQAVFAPGSYLARHYTILHANGGLGGTSFAGLTTAAMPTGLSATLGYGANDVFLNLTAVLGVGTGLAGNSQNVAGAINSYFNGGGALPPGFLPLFGLSGASLSNALSQLSGEATTGAQQAGIKLTNQFLTLMLDPYAYGRGGVFAGGNAGTGGALALASEEALPPEIALAYAKVMKAPATPMPATVAPQWSAWGGAFGGTSKTQGDAVAGSHDLTAKTGGFAAGLDYKVAPGTVMGFALAGGFTNWDLAGGIGGGSGDAFQAGLYAVTRPGPWYLAGALSFSQHWMKTERTAFAGNRLEGRFDAQSYGGRIETGWRVATPLGGVTPYAALQAQSFHAPGFAESDLNGGSFGLAYASRNANATRSELGARFERLVAVSDTALVSLQARAAWAHDWVSDPTLTPTFQALPGASFVVAGATAVPDLALVSAGAELRLAGGWSLAGRFDGELAGRGQTYSGTGTVRYAW
ncbi:MAG: autotransporter domain-containing protein [Rhodoplanes sp.]|uniref:autotransporter family protein n=1 Tax=Rhodoplanes sp. TaxID=1968906 RepID=UPI001806EFB9|nr:autotransporter domain-containing protein [Rhodoplanes sp.]NVO12608.1 autotransporter domain-containing protein [Rhodoplanes sp.]